MKQTKQTKQTKQHYNSDVIILGLFLFASIITIINLLKKNTMTEKNTRRPEMPPRYLSIQIGANQYDVDSIVDETVYLYCEKTNKNIEFNIWDYFKLLEASK